MKWKLYWIVALAKGLAVSLRISNQMLTLQPVQLCQDVLSTRRVLVLQAPLEPAPKAGWNIHKSPWPQWSGQIDCINSMRGVAAEVSSHNIVGKNWMVLMLWGGMSVSFDCCHWVFLVFDPTSLWMCDEALCTKCPVVLLKRCLWQMLSLWSRGLPIVQRGVSQIKSCTASEWDEIFVIHINYIHHLKIHSSGS